LTSSSGANVGPRSSGHLSLLSCVLSGRALDLCGLLLLLLLFLLLLLVLLLRLIELLLLLGGNLLVELVVVLVVLVVLEILELVLPDGTEGSSWVRGHARPCGLCAKELDALGAGGQSGVERTGCAGDAAELANVLEGVVAENVLCNERAAVEDHDGLCLAGAAVGDDGALGEDVLLELVAAAVVDGDLDLLYDEHDGADVAVLVPHVGLAEEVVQVVVEAVVDLVDDEDLVGLLHDLLLAAVVDDLKVLLLDLDHLRLLVEVVEAIGKVEAVATEAVDDGTVESIAKDVVVALRLRSRDGLSDSETSRKGESSESFDRHFEVLV
jgi:hypothetical protein